MSRRRLGLASRLLVALVLPAIVVFATMAIIAERASKRALDDALGARLTSIAGAAAAALEPRVLLLEPGDEESRTLKSALRKLEHLASETDIERILVVRAREHAVVLDTRGKLSIGAPYPRAVFDLQELERARTGDPATSVLFQGSDGRWRKSGYAPLRGPSVDDDPAPPPIAGYVVAEGNAAFFEVLDELRATVLAISVVGFLVLAALALLAARGVAEPLSELSRSAEAIGRGQLDTEVPTHGPREAMVLGETMRDMARALREREEELQVMLAGIAHEVRNPLTGIELFGGLLREDLEPADPRQKHVNKILKQIGVLSQVVNDFLDFARKRPIERTDVRVAELLDELDNLTDAPRKTKAQPLTITCPPELTWSVDRDQLARALLNLVRNASQAAPEGSTIELVAEADDNLRLHVVDHGPGVPPEKAREIFRPFFTTKQQGTGLGLALVKKAAEAHHGRVELTDTPGGGATFTLHLPPP